MATVLPLFGRLLIILGAVLIVVGLVFLSGGRLPFLGRLPGDIVYRRDHLTIYIPIVTMIVVSLLVTIILNLFRR